MSQKRWNEIATEQALKGYIKRHGHQPESLEIALEEHRTYAQLLILSEGKVFWIKEKGRFSTPEETALT